MESWSVIMSNGQEVVLWKILQPKVFGEMTCGSIESLSVVGFWGIRCTVSVPLEMTPGLTPVPLLFSTSI